MKVKHKNIALYGGAFILSLTQIFGGQFVPIAIVAASIWAFAYFLLVKRIDLFFIFLLLLPRFVYSGLEGVSLDTEIPGFWFRFIPPYFMDTFIIGPIALSTCFAVALAVPIKLLLTIRRNKNYFLLTLWLIALLLAIAGLLIALAIGIVNPSGLTVGFRIALSIGALFVPSFIDEGRLRKELKLIFYFSMALIICGLLNGHWIFVTSAFLPYYFITGSSKERIFCGISILAVILNAPTFTIQLSLFVGTLSVLLLSKGFVIPHVNRSIPLLIPMLPILFTIFAVNINKENFETDANGSKIQLFFWKFMDDRKPLWDATYKQLSNSNFWIAPAGRPTPVEGYLSKNDEWTAGAHNIFLEIPRQVGNFAGIILLVILVYFMSKIGYRLTYLSQNLLYGPLITAFCVYGLVGNSLVYDGVGFFYLLIVGQFFGLKNENAL